MAKRALLNLSKISIPCDEAPAFIRRLPIEHVIRSRKEFSRDGLNV